MPELDLVSRIVAIETRLESIISKLDYVVDRFEASQDRLSGDEHTPGVISRLITLEEFKKTITWSIGILYVAIITAAARLLMKE